MPSVVELSDPYANFMLPPASPETDAVCSVCLTFTKRGYPTCYQCAHHARAADAILPISYSVHLGPLHAALRGYKESWESAGRLKLELAAVLWRFLVHHEPCLARRAGVGGFDVVTSVPSSDPRRDASHPLHDIVGRLVQHTAERYERLLQRSSVDVPPRTVDVRRYVAMRALPGRDVLLVDDTWTTGAKVGSAALRLKDAGARTVGVVVIGRHINPEFGDNAERLKALPRYSWDVCAFE